MIEALHWLKSTPEALIAENRFGSADEAALFITRLYEAGALEVSIDEEKLIRDNYVDSFVVTLPADRGMREALFDIYREEQEEFGEVFGGDPDEEESVPDEDELSDDEDFGDDMLQDRAQLTLTFAWE
ncbi:MAG: hypothetical protein K2W95_34490 [Candidatus Obscuribacterales bacterium]|nr:hypothetical protein [Candidatus Obscuribacterales bacterium]